MLKECESQRCPERQRSGFAAVHVLVILTMCYRYRAFIDPVVLSKTPFYAYKENAE